MIELHVCAAENVSQTYSIFVASVWIYCYSLLIDHVLLFWLKDKVKKGHSESFTQVEFAKKFEEHTIFGTVCFTSVYSLYTDKLYMRVPTPFLYDGFGALFTAFRMHGAEHHMPGHKKRVKSYASTKFWPEVQHKN